jgi:hypothetical protein
MIAHPIEARTIEARRPIKLRRPIELRPIGRDDANTYVRRWHRHNRPVKGHKFAIAAVTPAIPSAATIDILGVVIVGRPSARALDDGLTLEVTRLATPSGARRNVASRLLGAAWRTARGMGVTRMVSYTRADERGTCYRAAGWAPVARVAGRAWSTAARPNPWLPGLATPATEIVDRVRWERRPILHVRAVVALLRALARWQARSAS